MLPTEIPGFADSQETRLEVTHCGTLFSKWIGTIHTEDLMPLQSIAMSTSATPTTLSHGQHQNIDYASSYQQWLWKACLTLH